MRHVLSTYAARRVIVDVRWFEEHLYCAFTAS
jgi:hypothetical protein